MEAMDALAARVQTAPYERALGLEVKELTAERVVLDLPFAESNSNPGGALHGGVAASLVLCATALVAAAGGGAEAAEQSTVDAQIVYLAAAIREGVRAEARPLRRGKELTFVDVAVESDAGKPIARGLTVRRQAPAAPAERLRAASAPPPPRPDAAPPAFTKLFTTAPFMARLGLQVLHVAAGEAVVRLPWQTVNADAAGRLHEGALAALADTTGAMASWSLVPLDARNKASTPAVHVSVLEAPREEDVVAQARTLVRRDEIFTNAVTLTGERSGTVAATATVTYRIVVPGDAGRAR